MKKLINPHIINNSMETQFKYSVALFISLLIVTGFINLYVLKDFLLKAMIDILVIFFSQYLLNPYSILFSFKLKKNEDPQLEEIVHKAMSLLKIKRNPEIFVMDVGDENAMVFGNIFFRGIMFTKGLLNVLNNQELLAITMHELSHLKNHDTETMLIIISSSTLFSILLLNYSIILGILTILLFVLLIPFISRWKEKRADITAVKENRWLIEHFINALIKTGYILQGHISEYFTENYGMGITDFKNIPISILSSAKQDLLNSKEEEKKLLSLIFDTHPSLQERIRYLTDLVPS